MPEESKKDKKLILGIDVGSVSISLIALSQNGVLKKDAYILHHGNTREALRRLLKNYRSEDIIGVATPSGKSHFTGQVQVYDQQVALMEAADFLELKARSILHVGAERFYLLELDEQGNYLQTSHSSSCAAGTGSFLDQQALRLNLNDTGHLSEMALRNSAPVPDIAARCSVFAKTDLIHAQQKGYGLEAICDSLCKGLADNIADTLFNKSIPVSPIFMSGGVALNQSVVRHLQRIIGKEIEVHPYAHHLPAIGAALLFRKELKEGKELSSPILSKLLVDPGTREYYYEPLPAPAGKGQEVLIEKQYTYHPSVSNHKAGIQVDLFTLPSFEAKQFHLGIDVGSTSTKAVLLHRSGKPFAGFYTYTQGQPLKAVQALYEAMDHLSQTLKEPFHFLSCGTTGSGRKFIAGIVRADQDYDEITAHARAAYELNPETDTIIEIGGQDAKFTRMNRGMVTFSHMNTVCAAGTGSFIEELAGRLGVKLKDYERLALGRKAPLASDRCTVFMERDINQLLSKGYSVEEVLATVIHSVRENYLKKVASEAHIGEHICFQGATAKNRALAAAFEQRLNKPIFISPLCHLTGALGTALLLKEEGISATKFRGLDLYKKTIPVQTETCELCLNHCTISVGTINGDKQAYGFLCGRDYETEKFVNKSCSGFELLKERRKLTGEAVRKVSHRDQKKPRVGMPAALHLMEDLPFWSAFFRALDIPLHTSERYRDSLKVGKKIAGAEFCAPIDAMYGHVAHVAETCDFVFMPAYLESRDSPGNQTHNFCYYTQFSASLAYQGGPHMRHKLVSPMLNFSKSKEHNARQLLQGLKKMGFDSLTLPRVIRAMKKADTEARQIQERLKRLFRKKHDEEEVSVVLLGRPYVVLSETLNKGIPDIFTGMGVRAWYQDMLQVDLERDQDFNRLLEKTPWHFASNILRAAELAGRTKNLYPVLITAFKCAPDSFIIDYFKQLMHLCNKPYLIIQIDEHDSNTGYETRIEAALRSFRNHALTTTLVPDPRLGSLLPGVENSVGGKTLLMPNWDDFTSPLVVANLRRAGMDARLLEPSELGIRKSMVHNTGQCLPINIIAQNCIDYIEKYRLDPSRTTLWMTEGHISCNLKQYPYYIKKILENYGQGLEKTSVYTGKITHRDISIKVTYYAYFAYMLGGLFHKTACRIRPYERTPGQTDQVFKEVHRILLDAFLGKTSLESAIEDGLSRVDEIDYNRTVRKPQVAIFGDLYVRDNETMNQGLIRAIEEAGGEALITPYHDYTKITIENMFRRAQERGEYMETRVNRALLYVVKYMDERYYKPFIRHLGPPPVIKPKLLEKKLEHFHIDLLHGGESYDNILKIFYLKENYPELSLFVQTNPSYCCPALVTEAMTLRIRELTGVSIVTLTYDGTSDQRNDAIVPYIRNALEKNKKD
ncbi:MAG: acyl-CoA dehydratase activase [Bacteroidales bacterium]|nr:acyl-CoA dehydratase activase [Bacteroidales bacterium]